MATECAETPRQDWLCTEATRLLLSTTDPETGVFLVRMKHWIQVVLSDPAASSRAESSRMLSEAFTINSDDHAESKHANRIIVIRRSMQEMPERLRFDATLALLDHAGGRVVLERLLSGPPHWDAMPLPMREAA